MIWWDLRAADEHPLLARAEAPPGLLSASEMDFAARLRFPGRRRDWILGRHAIKCLCLAWLARPSSAQPPVPGTAPGMGERRVPPAAIETAPDADGAPTVTLDGAPLPVTVSLSHRDGHAAVALAEGAHAPLGIDMEPFEPHSNRLVEDFFTAGEAAVLSNLAPDRTIRAVASMWTVKEAVLKAARIGLRADTRRVECLAAAVPDSEWAAVEVRVDPRLAREASVFVREIGSRVVAVAWLGGGASVPCDDLRGRDPMAPLPDDAPGAQSGAGP